MHLDVARLICDGINCITDAEGSDDPVPCTVREADAAGLHTVAQDHAAEERVEICFVGVGAIGIKGASRVDRVDLAGLFDILHAQDTLGIDFSLMPGADGKRQKRSVFLRQNTGCGPAARARGLGDPALIKQTSVIILSKAEIHIAFRGVGHEARVAGTTRPAAGGSQNVSVLRHVKQQPARLGKRLIGRPAIAPDLDAKLIFPAPQKRRQVIGVVIGVSGRRAGGAAAKQAAVEPGRVARNGSDAQRACRLHVVRRKLRGEAAALVFRADAVRKPDPGSIHDSSSKCCFKYHSFVEPAVRPATICSENRK